MATCSYCGRRGFFLTVDPELHLCANCRPAVVGHFNSVARVISESARIVEASKNLETRLSRCALIVEKASELHKFYGDHPRLQMRFGDETAAQIARRFQGLRPTLVAETCAAELDDFLLADESSTRTTRVRLNRLGKILEQIRKHAAAVGETEATKRVEQRILDVLHRVQLDDHLEKARKAEFKGQTSKALDAYFEALYFLRNDDIDDELQADQIATIEDKIGELGGEL